MRWTDRSLKNPAAVIVVVTIMLLLGVVTIFRLPVQLLPNIERPVMLVSTVWPGASPREIESEIGAPLEEVLRGMPGLEKIQAWAPPNSSFINLTFGLATDMDQAMLEVISRLNRLPALPADADPPTLTLGGWNNTSDALIDYFIQLAPGAEGAMADHENFVEDIILPRLESQYGVASVDLWLNSGTGDQLDIAFDPIKAAQTGIDLSAVSAQIGRSNDVSGGFVDVGRRQYTLRFEGRYSPEQMADLILEWRDGSPIRLGEIATIFVSKGRRDGFIFQNGRPAVRLGVKKESGANVLRSLGGVKAVVDELNAGLLKDRGLYMQNSYDPSVFIQRAIRLLSSNLVLGMFFAVGILWWFLRQARATILIAITIPISLLTTFIVLGLAGRTLNVISLAGLAFATGMVLDAAIVVLENIVRLKEKGLGSSEAASKGSAQVWGALFASTATTVAIFIPIMFLKDVEGQMFADLALTIAIGVSVSLVVAVTVLPTAAMLWLKKLPAPKAQKNRLEGMAGFIMGLTNNNFKRAGWISGLIGLSLTASLLLIPSMNYLPPVKRDALTAWVFFPPGSNVEFAETELADVMMARLDPYLKGEKQPQILDYNLFSWPAMIGSSVSVRATDPADLPELQRILYEEVLTGLPDVSAFVIQQSLFGGFNSSDSVEFNIHSADLSELKTVAIEAMDLIAAAIPGAPINPSPDPNIASPELEFIPNDRRLLEVGWRRTDLANVVRTLGTGVWLGEYFNGEKRLDVFFKTDAEQNPETMINMPVATPLGGIVPLGELVEMRENLGPGAIIRYDGRRTMSMDVNPPPGMTLEELITIIKAEVEPQILAMLPPDGAVTYGGSAGDLARAVETLTANFLIALALLFLIMAALFRSPKDALLVLISIPLATVGGLALLQILDLPLDLLTMIGFIILLGLVVNNAILLVVQTRSSEKSGLSREEAVKAALRLRLRPIFMSTFTSLAGMLPLLILPGAGSDIYRGMAAAIVGGMSVSMVFTLVLLPSLIQIEWKTVTSFSNNNTSRRRVQAPAE